ncbi:hypothetical protein GH714_009251 [Hevea brasiliensis]|uniref:Uncharacterized protein n=1 Tax=Hevea brasiliensis TaxID=3981 RepID=A0A6A6N378_HEVBR|nr:hypothetical protein GH714_009251 [Hevea brasiliensis]
MPHDSAQFHSPINPEMGADEQVAGAEKAGIQKEQGKVETANESTENHLTKGLDFTTSHQSALAVGDELAEMDDKVHLDANFGGPIDMHLDGMLSSSGNEQHIKIEIDSMEIDSHTTSTDKDKDDPNMGQLIDVQEQAACVEQLGREETKAIEQNSETVCASREKDTLLIDGEQTAIADNDVTLNAGTGLEGPPEGNQNLTVEEDLDESADSDVSEIESSAATETVVEEHDAFIDQVGLQEGQEMEAEEQDADSELLNTTEEKSAKEVALNSRSSVIEHQASYKYHQMSKVEKQSNSETFQNAVDCALEEVSRRVEYGLACSCIPKDTYDKLKFQIVENTGIRQEASVRDAGGADRLELVIARSQLLAFYRLKGYSQLPEFQFCGGLLENAGTLEFTDEVIEPTYPFCKDDGKISSGQEIVHAQRSSYHKRKHNLKDTVYPRKKERSLSELMGDSWECVDDEIGPDGKANNKLVSPSSGKKRKHEKVGCKRRQASHSIFCSPETFEFEDMNDTYWTDRVIQNGSEEQPPRKSRKRDNQLVSMDQDKALNKSNSRKRYSDGNYGLSAEKPVSYVDENAPAELVMHFPVVDCVPSEISLNKMFRRFGPLKESETEVDKDTNRARVVFKKCSDAEAAYGSAPKFNIFGSVLVNYQLNYTISVPFKSQPMNALQGEEDATLFLQY